MHVTNATNNKCNNQTNYTVEFAKKCDNVYISAENPLQILIGRKKPVQM